MRNSRFVRFSVFCLFGCILWFFVLRDYAVLAEELQEDTEEVVDQVNEYYEEVEDIGSVSFDEEDLDIAGNVLSDSFTSFSSLRSGFYVNTYTDTVSWKFLSENYRVNYPTGSSYNTFVFTYKAFSKGNELQSIGNTLDLVTDFYKNMYSSPYRLMAATVTYNEVSYDVLIISNYLSTASTQNALITWLNNNGFPEVTSNLTWVDPNYSPDPTPSVTPDPTPTVTPSPSPEVVFEYMEQRPDLIVIIFALGVFIGIFAGILVLRVLK